MKTFVAFLLALAPLAVSAQAYPSKPVKIIVPAQPGGGLDLIGRTMADQLSRALDQSFVVGYVGTHGTNPAVRKLPYDAIKDFTPIAMVGGTPNLLVVTSAVPVSDLNSFIDYAKKNPEKLNYGTGGIGLLNHLALEQFRAAAGLEEAVYAHYRGIGPAIADMLGGQIQVLMPGLAAALPHIRAGKLKPLAITGLQRHPLQPDLPTFEESGFKGFDGVQWYGIVGPARLPADITKRLNGEINKAIEAPALQQRLAVEAITVMPMSPAQFGQFIQADIARWSELARERGIRLD